MRVYHDKRIRRGKSHQLLPKEIAYIVQMCSFIAPSPAAAGEECADIALLQVSLRFS